MNDHRFILSIIVMCCVTAVAMVGLVLTVISGGGCG